MQYRPDIDGLRAVAIIPVVLYHLDIPGFSGGFIGVDVFFVISGFLITSLIYPQIASGQFSFASFYERRIRRLFPALLVMIVSTLAIAAALLLPHDFRAFARSVPLAILFGANFFFWNNTGYFDAAADTRPLLHVWSLSVEEQFYIIFPAFLVLIIAVLRRHVRWLVFVIAILSLFGSALMVHSAPQTVFYLPFFRAWELLLGALLAMGFLPEPSAQGLRNALATVGILLIAFGVFFFSQDTPFPGAYALVPCLGAALVIHSGGTGLSGVGQILSARSVVFIGLISYSLYLWHWPLIVFAKYFAIRELTYPQKLIILGISVAIAAASWRYVEQPFRGTHGLFSRRTLFKTAAVASAVLVLSGRLGFDNSTLPKVAHPVAATPRRVLEYQHCMNLDVPRIVRGEVCTLGAKHGGAPSFLLWGDSHGGALAPAIDRVAMDAGRRGVFVGQAGCLPFPGMTRHDRPDFPCTGFNDAALQLLDQNRSIRTVFLAARWAMYAEGSRIENMAGEAILISSRGRAGNAQSFREGLERTLQALGRRNIEVVFVTQVPEVAWDVPSVVARSQAYGREPPPPPTVLAYRARQKTVTSIVNDLSQRYPIRTVDIAATLCPKATCLLERGGHLLYLDSNHLSRYGTDFITPAFSGVF